MHKVYLLIFVWPCLILNYYGQGALLLSDPLTSLNPFYLLVPTWGIYPMILLSTMATIIASQSIISGVFSISWQAVQLGYLPRMKAIHTSKKQFGQVYLPVVRSSSSSPQSASPFNQQKHARPLESLLFWQVHRPDRFEVG